jgi:hypothetical protein
VDIVYGSGRIVVQRKSIVHTKMLNEGESSEGEA